LPTAHTSELVITYEGPGNGEDLVGAVQANFLVHRAGQPSTEVAVLVNHPALDHLAVALGQVNDAAFRTGAARVVGRLFIERTFERRARLGPVLVIAKATFAEDAGFLDAIRAAVGAA